MTDVLSQLNNPSWRGITYPITAWDFGFSQENETHRFIFRDEQLIESLGTTNPTYRHSIPFREDIVKGPFENLFTRVWPQFRAACLDRTKGILDDIFDGPVQVKVASLQATGDPERRDGIDVQVDYIVAPDEDFDRQDVGSEIANLTAIRGLSDYFSRPAMTTSAATQKALAEFNKNSDTGRVNPIDAATGAINQVEAAGNKIAASFGDVAFRAGKLDDAIRRNADPKDAPLRANARAMQLNAIDLQKRALGGSFSQKRKIRLHAVLAPIGKVALAAKLRMSVRDLLKLNPSIARMPMVPQGTLVAYYAT